MKLNWFKTKKEASLVAAGKAAEILQKAIKSKGKATLVAATGRSQIEFLESLVIQSIDWSKVEMFHLDEYIGLPKTHKASFRRFLKERLINKVHPGKINLINTKNPKDECKRLDRLIAKKKIDVTFLGIGESGHLAFNDPPADFKTTKPFIIVELDDKTKKQEVKEGWFSKKSDVPKQAISMSIKQIMKSKNIICLVFGKRKAKAVKECFGNKLISPMHPASILKKHKNTFIYLDKESAKLFKFRHHLDLN